MPFLQRPRWLIRSMIFQALLVACVGTMFAVFSPDHLILFPSREPISTYGAIRRTVPFRDGNLEIWEARSPQSPFWPGAKPSGSPGNPHQGQAVDVYVLRFYGNADRADGNVVLEAGEWREGTAEFWGVNYPGYGGSTGPARLASIGPAALAAFDALQKEAHGKPVVVYGTSLGTTAALHVAAHRPVAGVILQNPPPIKQIIRRQFGWWNLWLIAGPLSLGIPDALDSLANARACHAPAVFLLAEKDTLVKPKYQRLVVAAYAGEKKIVVQRSADHNEMLDPATTAGLNDAITWMLIRPAPQR